MMKHSSNKWNVHCSEVNTVGKISILSNKHKTPTDFYGLLGLIICLLRRNYVFWTVEDTGLYKEKPNFLMRSPLSAAFLSHRKLRWNWALFTARDTRKVSLWTAAYLFKIYVAFYQLYWQNGITVVQYIYNTNSGKKRSFPAFFVISHRKGTYYG